MTSTVNHLPNISYDTSSLTEREQMILRSIVQSYILTATPVGSQNLARDLAHVLPLSSATIRNVMSDLEERGYITHPHTSAGRIPTDIGYRYYVDSLFRLSHSHGVTNRDAGSNLVLPSSLPLHRGTLLDTQESNAIARLSELQDEVLLRSATRIIGTISRLLAIVKLPHIEDLLVIKIELIALSSQRILVVVALDSSVVRTITLEATFDIHPSEVEELSRTINERISGKTLSYIRTHFPAIIQETGDSSLLRLFINSIDELFARQQSERLHIAGTQHLLSQPEFESANAVRVVMELIENEEAILHVFDTESQYTQNDTNPVQVLIGGEMPEASLENYSVIRANYSVGSATCSIGLIGPKRMNYAKMISLVGEVVTTLSASNIAQ